MAITWRAAWPSSTTTRTFTSSLQIIMSGKSDCHPGLRQNPAARRTPLRCHASSSPEGRSPNESGPPPVPANSSTPSGFSSLEKLVASQAVQRTEAGGRTDWLDVEGCWVLKPPPEAGRPRAVAMFCGGAFAGAAPQLTYRLLLECLTRRNILVSLAQVLCCWVKVSGDTLMIGRGLELASNARITTMDNLPMV